MAKIKETTGDATRPSNEGEVPIIIPHVVNDIGKWGKGFVNAITKRWSEGPRQAYLLWANKIQGSPNEIEDGFNIVICNPNSFALGETQFVFVPNKVCIANMVGQHQIRGMDAERPPIRYGATAQAMFKVAELANAHKAEIHCPKFGSDLAGGDWSVIKSLIQEIWVDNDIDVTVYTFEM